MSLFNMTTAAVVKIGTALMKGQAGGGPLKSGAVNKALSNMNKSGYGAKISKAVRPSK
jgi:hypothetical protein